MKYKDTTSDSKNSVFLSYVSIVKIIHSLKDISDYKNSYQKINRRILKLISLFEDLNLILKKRFNLDFKK